MAKRKHEPSDSSEESEPIKHRDTRRRHSPNPDEQEDYDHELMENMSSLMKPFDPKEWLQDQIRKTPSWAISIAFHALILATFTLITFSEHVFKTEAPTVITVAAKPKTKVELPERPRGIVDRAGLDTGDPVANNAPAIFFPGAEESDHNESADGEDYGQMKGDSYEFLSALPGSEGGTKGRQPGKGRALRRGVRIVVGADGRNLGRLLLLRRADQRRIAVLVVAAVFRKEGIDADDRQAPVVLLVLVVQRLLLDLAALVHGLHRTEHAAAL
jgi:hypothetical protein